MTNQGHTHVIDLYTAPTANGLRASLAMAESGLAYRLHKLDPDKDTKSAEFLALNPAGQVPVLVDPVGPGGGRLVVAQSGAIVLYLAEKTGRFVPQDARRRVAAQQWFMVVTTDLQAANLALFLLEHEAPERPPALVEFFRQRLLRFYASIDQRLAGRDYLADEISIADQVLYPNYFRRKAWLQQDAAQLKNLHRWAAQMAARPGVAEGVSI